MTVWGFLGAFVLGVVTALLFLAGAAFWVISEAADRLSKGGPR